MTTQKEWQLETRIKRLEGNDLQSIVEEYNKKIESIFDNAVKLLDDEQGRLNCTMISILRNQAMLDQIEYLRIATEQQWANQANYGGGQYGLQGLGSSHGFACGVLGGTLGI